MYVLHRTIQAFCVLSSYFCTDPRIEAKEGLKKKDTSLKCCYRISPSSVSIFYYLEIASSLSETQSAKQYSIIKE